VRRGRVDSGGYRYLSLDWPRRYRNPGSHWPADQLLDGFRTLGIDAELTDVPQATDKAIVLFRVVVAGQPELIAFDHDDRPRVEEAIAGRVLVYFKQQYRIDGYAQPNVLPGGYTPANSRIYRYLPLLRAIRRSRRFRWDVYCRFGMKWGGQELRRRAHELLSARDDLTYEGSLFRYPGGPDKVPYRTYLFEIPRAKVCVDMPGGGDFTTRLIDYLAVGACVVKPPPRARLPIRLVDGVHLVYCAPDLSDLGEVCAQLARDDETREAIARNASDFFDRHLHRRQIARRYLDAVTDLHAGTAERAAGTARPVASRRVASRTAVKAARVGAIAIAAAMLAFVVLPEALGDRPYDPRPSHVVDHVLKP
jgi:Glycosyl transferases group 1